MVVRINDGALANVTVINNTGGSRHWLTTDTVQLISTRLVVHESVDDVCTIVMPSATMHLQNHAGSGIKRGSC